MEDKVCVKACVGLQYVAVYDVCAGVCAHSQQQPLKCGFWQSVA